MNIVIDDELEKKFREAVFRRKGMKKGNISDALQEAINQWIDVCHPELRGDIIERRKKQ